MTNNLNAERAKADHPDETTDYQLKDADNHDGIVPDDALQKVNPAAAARATSDADPHHVAKSHTQYDTDITEDK